LALFAVSGFVDKTPLAAVTLRIYHDKRHFDL